MSMLFRNTSLRENKITRTLEEENNVSAGRTVVSSVRTFVVVQTASQEKGLL